MSATLTDEITDIATVARIAQDLGFEGEIPEGAYFTIDRELDEVCLQWSDERIHTIGCWFWGRHRDVFGE